MSEYTNRSNYYSDRRVSAGERGSPFKRVDQDRMTAEVTLLDAEGNEEDVTVPIRFEVCDTCRGKGRHVNPSVDCDGLTAEDFAEDPDFGEDYMSGCYDVPCYECNGQRVVPALADDADPEVVKRLQQKLDDETQYRAEVNAERRFGC